MTTEQNELITQNINLARYVAGKYKTMPLDPDDILAQALLGLTKAAGRYDVVRGASFATFACKVMEREILAAYRLSKKHLGLVSLDAPLKDSDGKEVTLKDVIPAPEDTYDGGLNKGLSVRLGRLKLLSKNERRLFDLMIKCPGMKQREYSQIVGASQGVVSRRIRAIREKLRG